MTEAEKVLKELIKQGKNDSGIIVGVVKGKQNKYSFVFKGDGSQIVFFEGKQLKKPKLKPPPIPTRRDVA